MSASGRTRTEVVSEVVFLGKLVERIAAGQICVPRFQRSFVWKQIDVLALLDSVLRGFPIGSILVWDTERRIEATGRIGPIEISPRPDGLVSYLLDGQQRVSTLVSALRLSDDANPIADEVDWRIYCDLESGEFLRAATDGPAPQMFPVRSLLNTAGFFAACRRIASEVEDKKKVGRWLNEADRLASAFRDYQLPLIHIREAALDSAVTVFARLNRTGRKMTADEMVSALTYKAGEFHLARELDEFQDELARRGFGNLKRIFLLRAVLAALDRDIYAKDWADLMVKEEVRATLPERFEVAANGIRRALQFLAELGVTSDRLLPYGLQLVLLGEFFRLCPEPNERVTSLLRRWFWVTSFTSWFGGVSNAQATRALGEMRALARKKIVEFSIVDLQAPAQPFPERFDGRSARVRAFLLYLVSLRPRSLRGSGDLEPGQLLSELGTRALGHVSSSSDELGDLFRSPGNRMFLDRDRVGQAYGEFANIEGDTLREVLDTHGFPAGAIPLLRDGRRAELIRSRLTHLMEGEREFLKARHVGLPAEGTTLMVADSDASDDE